MLAADRPRVGAFFCLLAWPVLPTTAGRRQRTHRFPSPNPHPRATERADSQPEGAASALSVARPTGHLLFDSLSSPGTHGERRQRATHSAQSHAQQAAQQSRPAFRSSADRHGAQEQRGRPTDDSRQKAQHRANQQQMQSQRRSPAESRGREQRRERRHGERRQRASLTPGRAPSTRQAAQQTSPSREQPSRRAARGDAHQQQPAEPGTARAEAHSPEAWNQEQTRQRKAHDSAAHEGTRQHTTDSAEHTRARPKPTPTASRAQGTEPGGQQPSSRRHEPT